MAKDKDPFSFNFGANAVRKPAKSKGSGGKSKKGSAKWAGKKGAAFRASLGS